MTITADSISQSRPDAPPLALRLGHAAVALAFLTSFFVKIEPALCDLLFFLAVALFYRDGLRITRIIAPLFLILLVYNVSGLVAYINMDVDPANAGTYVFIGFYMSFSAIFFAAYIAFDPAARFHFIMKYYFWGAAIGSVLGLLAYFHFLPESFQMIAYGGRIESGFKDPNVFSTYLVLPAVVMLQMLLQGRASASLINVGGLMAILAALFLAFSRGAWIDFCLASILTIALSTYVETDAKVRSRVLFRCLIAFAALLVVIIALLSIKEIANLFWDRFTLLKSYDLGEFGRFGNQKNAIPMLLVRPFGFGPLQYNYIFHVAPHNAYVNSFASFGWIGGISFFTLVIANLFVGLKLIFIKSPYQASAISVFCCLAVILFQSIQIDSEHWRHIYWMMGMLWGMMSGPTIYRHYKGVN